MKVINPGDWARQALEMKCTMAEYETYLQGLVHGKSRVVELGERKGSMTTEHYVLVDGHPLLIYVIEPEVHC